MTGNWIHVTTLSQDAGLGCEAVHSFYHPIFAGLTEQQRLGRELFMTLKERHADPVHDADLYMGRILERARQYRATAIRALLAVLFAAISRIACWRHHELEEESRSSSPT